MNVGVSTRGKSCPHVKLRTLCMNVRMPLMFYYVYIFIHMWGKKTITCGNALSTWNMTLFSHVKKWNATCEYGQMHVKIITNHKMLHFSSRQNKQLQEHKNETVIISCERADFTYDSIIREYASWVYRINSCVSKANHLWQCPVQNKTWHEICLHMWTKTFSFSLRKYCHMFCFAGVTTFGN